MLVKQMVSRVKIHFIWRLTSIFRGRAHPCLHLLHNCFYPVSRGPCSQGKLSREVMSHSLHHAKLFCLLSLELQIKFDKIGQCFSFSFLFLAIFALCKSFHFALFCSHDCRERTRCLIPCHYDLIQKRSKILCQQGTCLESQFIY